MSQNTFLDNRDKKTKIFDLKLDIDNNPSSYTAWLKIIFNKHFKYFESYENNNLQKKSL